MKQNGGGNMIPQNIQDLLARAVPINAPAQAQEIAPEIARVREINAARAFLESQTKEAEDIIAILPSGDDREKILAYLSEILAFRQKLAVIHARALLAVKDRVLKSAKNVVESCAKP